MLFQICILLFLLFNIDNCITNIGYDGPDVVRKSDAEEEFQKILIAKLAMLTDLRPGYSTPSCGGTGSNHVIMPLCERDLYYYQKDVDECLELLTLNQSENSVDLFVQHYLMLSQCDLPYAVNYDSRDFIQGEYRICK